MKFQCKFIRCSILFQVISCLLCIHIFLHICALFIFHTHRFTNHRRIEPYKSLDENLVVDDLLHLDDDILNFDVTAYRRREEMKEFEEWERKVDESEVKNLQELYKDESDGT